MLFATDNRPLTTDSWQLTGRKPFALRLVPCTSHVALFQHSRVSRPCLLTTGYCLLTNVGAFS